MRPTRLGLTATFVVVSRLFALLYLQMSSCSEAYSFPRVHAFFYLWYGNPETDGKYLHWNHEILPHWDPVLRERYPYGIRFQPPRDIHSGFYPKRGCYSSRDRWTLKEQLKELVHHGVGAVAASWWGPEFRAGTSDTQGVSTDSAILDLLAAAEEVDGMYVAFHLEPYPGRSAATVGEDVKYLLGRVGSSRALLRLHGKPVFYVYDSYHIPSYEWATVLGRQSKFSLRGTPYDGFFIALFLNEGDGHEIVRGQFDGFYTYFASEAVSYGSKRSNWKALAAFAKEARKAFVASVGPGYNDTRIRPWNAATTVDREEGLTYDRAWSAAITAGADIVSITSYNEWGEGTQIEPAVQKEGYASYGEGAGAANLYLESTLRWSKKFRTEGETMGNPHDEL